MSSDSCSFQFDPAAWCKEHDRQCSLPEDILEDGVWDCPHKSEDSTEYCIFHRPPEADPAEAVADALYQKVNQARETSPAAAERDRRFIGAKFGDLPLQYISLGNGSNHPIDLRYVQVEGTFDIEYATLEAPIHLTGSTIKEISGHATTFSKRVEAAGMHCDSVDFQSATFVDRSNFTNAEFGQARIFNVVFEERAIFRSAEFDGLPRFNSAQFNGDAIYTRATFNQGALFESAAFTETASFNAVVLRGDLVCANAEFEDQLRCAPSDASKVGCTVELSNSLIQSGELIAPADVDTTYVLVGATIGDVELESAVNVQVFDKYQILETTFEGFDFSSYTSALISRQWRIHQLETRPEKRLEQLAYRLRLILPMWGTDNSSPTFGELRSTYLKAKNGAEDIGDNTAAAEFFLQEMRYKRKAYLAAENRNTMSVIQWALNWGYNILAGYGERPSRPFFSSLGWIILFGWAYTLYTDISFLRGIGVSLQAYVALVLGVPPQAGEFPIIAALEAFIGAFMIALFVFTLTRSIRR